MCVCSEVLLKNTWGAAAGRDLQIWFPSPCRVFPPFPISRLWSLHTGAEVRVLHRVWVMCVCRRKPRWLWYAGDVMCDKGGDTGTISALHILSTSPTHTVFAFFLLLSSLCLCVCESSSLDACECPTRTWGHHSWRLWVSDYCAHACALKPVILDVHPPESPHLRVNVKATFDFNLSWNLLCLFPVILFTLPALVLLFLFL